MLVYLEIRISDAFGWPQSMYIVQIRLSVLIQILHSVLYKYVHKHTKHTHKHNYKQIILVLLHLHQPVLYIDGVTTSSHIMEQLAMHFVTSCCL